MAKNGHISPALIKKKSEKAYMRYKAYGVHQGPSSLQNI